MKWIRGKDEIIERLSELKETLMGIDIPEHEIAINGYIKIIDNILSLKEIETETGYINLIHNIILGFINIVKH